VAASRKRPLAEIAVRSALEPIEEEVRRVLSDEEDNFANRSKASKETEAGQISKEAQHDLDRARSAIDNALDLMRLVVGADSNDIEQSTQAPWPLVSSPPSRR
jgi:hypothetical protein